MPVINSIFRFGKTYKKEQGTSLALCRFPKMNVVVLLSKIGVNDESVRVYKTLRRIKT